MAFNVGLLTTAAVRAGTATNPGAAIVGQLCPMLDNLTQAAISAAQSNRTTASAQLNSTFSLSDGLMSTVQSPGIATALGKDELVLQTRIFRFQSLLTKTKASVDNSAVKNAAALKAVLKAVSVGQQLKALLLTMPFSNTVVMVSETRSSTIALHYSGDTVCFHVGVLNAISDSSCGTVSVSVDRVGGDPTDVVTIGPPSMSSPTDFCLTMGPDADLLRVTVSTCSQTNSLLLYNYGLPRKSGPPLDAPQILNVSSPTASSMELAWTYGASDADGVKIERGTTSAGPWTLVGVTNSTTTYVDSGLGGSTTYYYRMRAYNNISYSPYSGSAKGTTASAGGSSGGSGGNTPPPDTTAPSVPSSVSATANSSTQISVTWSASSDTGGSGVAGYTVYRNGTLVGTTAATSYGDTGLAPSTQYCYTITASDNAGNISSSSSQGCVTTQPAPSPSPSPSPTPTPSPSPTSMPADEFNGPFASWADLKANYGAKGDGTTDDTSALQSALNDLGKSGHAAVLYVPAGTYLITSTVTLQSQQHVSIIGADPSTTTLKWGGATGGVLLHIDGVAYSRFDRLTFAGSGTAGVLVDQSMTSAGLYFDTGNEYADDVFEDASDGIRGGNNGLGAAESSVLRCQFLRQTEAGVILKNFNALDWFIWYCTFADNYDGVSNNPGAGNFHVFGSLFQRSTNADIDIVDLGLFSFRYNTSIGSKQFLSIPNTWANGAELMLQGNTIADTTSDTAISIGTLGPVFLIDNVIASRSGATGAAVAQIGYDTTELVAVGNTFTVSNPMSVTSSMGTSQITDVDNQTVARSSLTITAPTLPGVLPNNNRTVFEVPAGSSGSTIQTAINQAAALSGQRPVVHLAQGIYTILSTLTVPANADIQIIGDGGMTDLEWGGPQGTSPVIELAGPSRAILRDFMIQTYGKSAGIQVDNADQAGARIFMEQATLSRGLTAGLLVDQLDNAVVELHDFYPSATYTAPAVTGTGLKVVGGPSASGGNPLGGRTSVFAGAASANYLSFDVVSGGSLLVNDVWYESTVASTFAHVADNSTFTVDNCRMALPQTAYSVQMNNLSGKASVLSCQPDAPVAISGTGAGTAWVAGNESHGSTSSYFSNTATSTTGVFSDNRWYDPSYGSRSVPDQGTADASLVRNMLAHLRSERPLNQPDVLPSGVTDLRLYRVFVDSAVTDIHLSP
ncbi:MAG TPA: glycosyl hydrolase family 28-related protein [Verrucomicrobiae bacterium]|nr:glycosyl hydrolase family 28-related protein [Verrucomicrobiae bacterium]